MRPGGYRSAREPRGAGRPGSAQLDRRLVPGAVGRRRLVLRRRAVLVRLRGRRGGVTRGSRAVTRGAGGMTAETGAVSGGSLGRMRGAATGRVGGPGEGAGAAGVCGRR